MTEESLWQHVWDLMTQEEDKLLFLQPFNISFLVIHQTKARSLVDLLVLIQCYQKCHKFRLSLLDSIL